MFEKYSNKLNDYQRFEQSLKSLLSLIQSSHSSFVIFYFMKNIIRNFSELHPLLTCTVFALTDGCVAPKNFR